MKNYDLIVIGAGSGGVRTARWAAGLGAKVAICEKDERFGGTCVLRGCVPKKLMIYASEFGKEIEIAQNFGWNMQGSFEWKKFKDIREKELNRLSEIYQGLLDNKSVDIYSGVAQFQDSNTLKIKDQTISAPKIVIATGSRPFIPNCEGNELAWSSNDVFLTDSQPKSILVVGGGFIAVEFAGIFKGLGSKVSLALRKDTILTGFDSESCKFLQEEISKKSIEILSQHQVSSLKKIGDQIEVQFQNGLQKIFDRVLFATGRVPNTHHLGLEKTKVELNSQGAIQVDSHFQTNDPSIYALGDVIDKVNLTPVATTQGTFLAEYLFKQKDFEMSYENIPCAIFSQPPFATVGLTEEEARKEHQVDIYKANFRALKHTISGAEERTFMKMIVDQKSQKVLGLHMVGKDAPEIIQLGGVCLKAGLTKDFFDQTIGIHPSSAEEFVTMRTKS